MTFAPATHLEKGLFRDSEIFTYLRITFVWSFTEAGCCSTKDFTVFTAVSYDKPEAWSAADGGWERAVIGTDLEDSRLQIKPPLQRFEFNAPNRARFVMFKIWGSHGQWGGLQYFNPITREYSWYIIKIIHCIKVTDFDMMCNLLSKKPFQIRWGGKEERSRLVPPAKLLHFIMKWTQSLFPTLLRSFNLHLWYGNMGSLCKQ